MTPSIANCIQRNKPAAAVTVQSFRTKAIKQSWPSRFVYTLKPWLSLPNGRSVLKFVMSIIKKRLIPHLRWHNQSSKSTRERWLSVDRDNFRIGLVHSWQAGSTDDGHIDFYVFTTAFTSEGNSVKIIQPPSTHGPRRIRFQCQVGAVLLEGGNPCHWAEWSSLSVGSVTSGRRRCFVRRVVAAWDLVAHCVARSLYYRRVILVLAVFVRLRYVHCEPQNNSLFFVSEVRRQGGDTLAETSQ